ncbi:MAG: thioesterase family protein, partial [Rikenellaceae bacterium]|nr:thioesterase family protein [Rikenellaceae bacterium]
MELKEGLSHTSELTVSEAHSAKHWGSGALDVLATPALIALMENAAMNAVRQALPEGGDTVGTEVCVSHVKATGIGDTVRATARLKKIDGRKLVFEVSAGDSKGEIGSGTHT